MIALTATILAHRNLRAGRGDLRGAGKIAGVVGGLRLLGWVFGVHHALSAEEFLALGEAVGLALLLAAVAWVGYLAVEPHFRRHWPTQLVTWSRLLEGRVRDPMVSRHLLLGVLVALLFASIQGRVPNPSRYLSGVARLQTVAPNITSSLGLASLLALSHLVLRSRRLAVTVFVLLCFGLAWVGETALSGPLAGLGLAIVVTLAGPGLLLQAGLLPLVVVNVVALWVMTFPLTVDRSVWFFPDSMLTLGALLALTLWAFYHSLGGRPMFGEETDLD